MMSPTSLMTAKCAQTVTPVTYGRNNLRIPSRKLLQENGSNWNIYRNSGIDRKWDAIESPQFVDFAELPENGDSFFDKKCFIASTPKPNIASDGDALISSLSNISFSHTENSSPNVTIKHVPKDKDDEQYIVHTVQQEDKIKTQKRSKPQVKKPQCTAVAPFTFCTQERNKQEQKQERIKKILEEEKKMRVFRANPVPKFLKTRSAAHDPNQEQNNKFSFTSVNSNNQNNNNEKISDHINGKIQKINYTEKHIKKTRELWRKPPFVPCISRKNTSIPQIPPLHSTLRAQERKRFDEAIKEKEKEKEKLKEMELALQKKREEEEIARIRKETVHKAQPIRKYKLGLPQIQKRPLTDPVSPISFKRRRRM